jgi:hypothetical protein
MVAILQEKGSNGGKALDVTVGSVIEPRGHRIARVTANISDIEEFDRYLSEPESSSGRRR